MHIDLKPPVLPLLAVALTVSASMGLPQPAAAQVAELIGDFAENTARSVDSRPGEMTSFSDRVLFFATTPGSGREPWGTEGTAKSTRMLADSCPGTCGVHFVLGRTADRIFWAVPSLEGDGVGQAFDLWSSDGTVEGTVKILEDTRLGFRPPNSLEPETAVFQEALLFPAAIAGDQFELWRSDGSPSGTYRLSEFGTVFQNIPPTWLTPGQDRVYFLARDGEGEGLFETDGTVSGTRRVSTDGAPQINSSLGFRDLGPFLFFLEIGSPRSRLWRLDPSTGEAVPLDPDGEMDPLRLLQVRGHRLFFVAADSHGRQLWVTDGTPQGTLRLSDVPSGDLDSSGSFEPVAEAVGDRILFTAAGETAAAELWQSGGTLATTRRFPEGCDLDDSCRRLRGEILKTSTHLFVPVGDGSRGEVLIADGAGNAAQELSSMCGPSCPTEFTALQVVGDEVFFLAGNLGEPLHGWRTDGTRSGTQRFSNLRDAGSSVDNETQRWVAPLGRAWVAALPSDRVGREPWFTKGSPRLEKLLADISSGVAGSEPFDISPTEQGIVALLDLSGATRPPVVGSQGTRGTSAHLISASAPPFDWRLRSALGRAYAWAHGGGETSLWTSDGTPAGTSLLLTLDRPSSGSSPDLSGFVPLDDEVFFLVPSGEDLGIWRSSGTTADTRRIFPPSAQTDPRLVQLATDGESLFYSTIADDGSWTVWMTDRTASSPQPALTPEILSFRDLHIYSMARLGGTTYFLGCLNGNEFNLWRTGGTPETSERVARGVFSRSMPCPRSWPELEVWQGELYFLARDDSLRLGLWKSDGTEEGTRALVLGTYVEGAPPDLAVTDQNLFFPLAGNGAGTELWASDGTEEGTRMVLDLRPGSAPSTPRYLEAVGDRVYFSAANVSHGVELWVSDGSEAGTRLVHDIHPGPLSSSPRDLTLSGDKLYFTADDGLTGRELWVLPLDRQGPPCRASEESLCLRGGRFEVKIQWRNFQGQVGKGHSVPLTEDTGYFWFFNQENVEAILKVLDGRSNNGHFWTFYGALSNVEYNVTVTDTETGLTRRYFNASRNFASVGDTFSFGPRGANSIASPGTSVAGPEAGGLHSEEPLGSEPLSPASALLGGLYPGTTALPPVLENRTAPEGTCTPSATRLCLNGSRFAVEAAWTDFSGDSGAGTAVSLTDDTGYFWFFRESNVEIVLKVLDGTAHNGTFWVFYGALSNVDYHLTVTDTTTGRVRTYQNRNRAFASVGDTGAFPGV